jgi:hypothetical protein
VDFLAEPIPGPKTCLAEPITVPEISYEVEFYYASHISIDGPKKGRAGTFKRVCMDVYFWKHYLYDFIIEMNIFVETDCSLPYCQNVLKCS